MIRFNLKNHYNVRCVKCGEVSGVDVDEISDLIEMIHDTNGIKYLDYDIKVFAQNAGRK